MAQCITCLMQNLMYAADRSEIRFELKKMNFNDFNTFPNADNFRCICSRQLLWRPFATASSNLLINCTLSVHRTWR